MWCRDRPVRDPAASSSTRSGVSMPLLHPDAYFIDVQAIDLGDLRRDGVEGLLLDLDNTLLPRDTNTVPDQLRSWVDRVRESGMRVCLISNNWHERVKSVADELGFELVSKALKPLPFAFRRAARLLGTRPDRTAVVGDQIFTDILGGNLVGAHTILVKPLSDTDLPHTLLLRRVEERIMAGREPKTGIATVGPSS